MDLEKVGFEIQKEMQRNEEIIRAQAAQIKQEMERQAAAVDAIVNQAKAEAAAQHQRFLMEMEANTRSHSQLPLDVQVRMSHPEHFSVQGGLPLDVRQRLGTPRHV